MNGRTWSERAKRRRERRSSGVTSLRISRATRAKIEQLTRIIQPAELRGVDELIDELVTAELQRRGVPPQPDPNQLNAL